MFIPKVSISIGTRAFAVGASTLRHMCASVARTAKFLATHFLIEIISRVIILTTDIVS